MKEGKEGRKEERKKERKKKGGGLNDLWSRLHMKLQLKILGLSTLDYHSSLHTFS